MKDINVLFVDDEQLILESLKRNLYREPFNTLFAVSATEALEIFSRQPIHVIVCDLKMPCMDGLSFLKKVKEMYPETVRVVLTGYVQVSQIIPCINTGEIYRYVIKPIEPPDFKQTLRDAINYYLLQRDRQDLIDRLAQRNLELERALEELKQKETHLLRLSLLDELTNIPNRRNFNKIITQEWLRARRHQSSLSLIMIDIDEFAAFNNTYGHQEGDICLQQVAKAMQSVLKRPADLAARYGGEEFAVVLPETCEEGAFKLAETMRSEVEALKIPHATSTILSSVTISAGVATIIPSKCRSWSVNSLIELADKELYLAKKQGKNRVSQVRIPIIFDKIDTEEFHKLENSASSIEENMSQIQ